jgi:hypothetical protein
VKSLSYKIFKLNYYNLLILFLCLFFSISIYAQTNSFVKSTEVRNISFQKVSNDSLKEKKNKSKDTLSSKDVHPQDAPETSGLVIESKDKNLSMRFYGSVRVFGSYDFNGLQGGTGFALGEIPVKEEDLNEETFYMTANVTRLGIEVKRKTFVGNTLIRIETDFNGPDNKFRIRQAYGQTSHFIVGQTWTNFSDIETLPLTVDVDGPPTAVTSRPVLIKYYLDFDPGWRFRASIESPSSEIYIPDSLSVEEVSQNYPAVAANIKKDWKAFQIKFAAILNPISVRNLSGDRASLIGQGAFLSMNGDLSTGSSLKFQGLLGKGIASYLNLGNNAAYDVILDPNDGEYQLTACYGGFVAYNQVVIDRYLDIDVVYGLVKLNMEDYFPDDSFKAGEYIALNAFFTPPELFRLGIEYTYGLKKDKNGKSGNANRFAFTFYFTF